MVKLDVYTKNNTPATHNNLFFLDISIQCQKFNIFYRGCQTMVRISLQWRHYSAKASQITGVSIAQPFVQTHIK